MTYKKHYARIVGIAGILMCISLIVYSKVAYTAALLSGSLIIKTVLPILIPYIVLSCIIADSISSEDAIGAVLTAFILGNLCGAPIGGVQIAKLHEKGVLSSKEASAVLPAVSAASPAFCISAIGEGLFYNKRFGILVWITQLFVNFTVLFVFLINYKIDSKRNIIEEEKRIDFSDAIKRASSTTCQIAISIIFFSVISAVICNQFKLGGALEATISALLEMSGGCRLAQGLASPASYLISAFAIGFGGISVLTQISSCTHGISKTRYVVCKLINGAVCAIAALINSLNFFTALENLTK